MCACMVIMLFGIFILIHTCQILDYSKLSGRSLYATGQDDIHTQAYYQTGNDVTPIERDSQHNNDVTTLDNDVTSMCTIQRRVELIRDRCERLGLVNKSISEEELLGKIARREIGGFDVNQAQKVMYCHLYKAGSSTMKAILISAASRGKTPRVNIRDFFNEKHDPSELSSYHRFTIVRHPLTRLRSAYMDKYAYPGQNFLYMFEKEKGVAHRRFGRDFVPDVEGELRLTWEQFLDLVATEPKQFANKYWDSYMSMCDPCLFNYDHVMRLETMDEDMEPLIDRLHMKKHIQVKRNTSMGDVKDQLGHVSELFRQVPDNIMKGIMNRYRLDFELFGYTWDKQRGAGCAVVTKDNICC